MGAGPARILSLGLVDRLRERGGRVELRELQPTDGTWVAEIGTAFDFARQLARAVAESRTAGVAPLVLAGNCITSVGTIGGLGPGATGVLWFDAHGDFNTPETTVGGFLDGMALATVVGRCWTSLTASVPGFASVDEANVVLVGARDLDAAEADLLGASRITRVRVEEGADRLEGELEALGRRVDRLYVHVDLDVLDASEGRANAYAGGRGLSRTELLGAIGSASRHCRVAAAAITAYDPSYDAEGRIALTAIDVALALTSSRFGGGAA